MGDEDLSGVGVGFWPAFTDLMLSVILILLLVIGGSYFSAIDIRKIAGKQRDLAGDLGASSGSGSPVGVVEIRGPTGALKYRLSVDPHDPMLQKISFSDAVLFDEGKYDLKESGKVALSEVGKAVKRRLEDLVEIQIHGHADHTQVTRYRDNLELASLRANEVFRYLNSAVGIDPSRNLISATSFGQYSPALRRRDGAFDPAALAQANTTESQRAQNRRIEMLLFYRRTSSASPTASGQGDQ